MRSGNETMTSSRLTGGGSHPGDEICAGCTDIQRGAFMQGVARLVQEHRNHLFRVARREGLVPEDAFDVVQEAFQEFVTFPSARTLVETSDDARKVLTVLTRNRARNRRRRAFIAQPHETSDVVLSSLPAALPPVDQLLESAEESVRLHGCVQSLSDVQRAVVTLRMLEEADGESVARTLRLSPAHVAVLLHRAKASLFACMTNSAGGNPAT